MNLKKIGKVFTNKFLGTGPSSYKKIIYLAAVSQRLRNTGLKHSIFEDTSALDLITVIICHPCGPPNNFSCGLVHDVVGRPALGSLMQQRMAGLCVTD
jgi:hypothetical protein